MATLSRVWREGIVSGLLGAAGVAIWFLGVDLIAGHPFYTPSLLGSTMLSVLGHGINEPPVVNVLAYTLFHVAAFIGVGVVSCTLVDVAKRVPQVTVGLALLFVVFEVGFYFGSMFISQIDVVGALAWYQILAANIVASVLMGTYIWRHHPELKQEFLMALEGKV